MTRTLAAMMLAPTFLWSGLPAVGCNCSEEGGVTVALETLSINSQVDRQPSYCHCASCASQSGGPCCCCCSKSPVQQEKGDFVLKKRSCTAVVHSGIVTTSPKVTSSDIDFQIEWFQLGGAASAANPEIPFKAIEWNTGPPPPIDLVVSLRRLLV
ncbi:MAG: hypothetical protein IT427_17145 [Pirellulales bacterium]|nr:hypothetical protein [Pirellulales bacterium]